MDISRRRTSTELGLFLPWHQGTQNECSARTQKLAGDFQAEQPEKNTADFL